MADAERRSPENLSAQRTGMDHCAHVGVSEKIDNVVLARFDIYFDFGEAGYIGVRVAIARVIVARGRYQALARERRDGGFGRFIDVGRRFMPVILSTKFNCALSGLCKG